MRHGVCAERLASEHALHGKPCSLRHQRKRKVMRKKRKLKREKKTEELFIEEPHPFFQKGEKRKRSDRHRDRRTDVNARPFSDRE